MSLQVDIRKQLSNFELRVKFETKDGTLCFLGRSGCGKSMTLKCIAGIEKPDSGRIVLNGRVLFDSEQKINLPPQKRHVGYLFQNYALFPGMTVRQNILSSMYKSHDRAQKEKILDEMLRLVRLEGYADRMPSALSGGQQQRVALARILVSSPEILLLDEPFTALDAWLSEKLQMEMKELLAEYGREVILVTHSRDEAYRLADSIGVIDEGRLLTVKKTADLFEDPEYPSVCELTGCKNNTSAERINDHRLRIPAWNFEITTEKTLPADLSHAGIRAHAFSSQKNNTHKVIFTGSMEEPFEWIGRFRFEGQKEETEDLWWRVPKTEKPEKLPEMLGFNEKDLLILRREK